MYNPDTATMPNAQVSTLSIKDALSWKPRVCMHTMLWWNPKSGSHINLDYLSSDPTVCARQVTYAKTRGVDFLILEWYGTMGSGNDAALQLKSECEKQGLNFAIGMDCGMFKPWDMPKGVDKNTWAKTQLDYVVKNFFTSPNYEKTADGRFFMINFNWQGEAGLDANAVFAQYPQIAMLWEHSGGVSQPKSAGAFAWLGVTGKYDPQAAIENYAKSFLAATSKAAANNKNLIIMGSLARGFDDHNRMPNGDPTKSAWDATAPYRWADEKQGDTFLNVIDIYNNSAFKPQYMQLVTFNDYEEGTALERGICSGVAASLSVKDGILTASVSGNLKTVHSVAFFVNAQAVSLQDPAATLTFDLNSIPGLVSGQALSCAVGTIGKAFFQNTLSKLVSTTPNVIPGQPVPLNLPSVPVDIPEQVLSVPSGLDTVDAPFAGGSGALAVVGTLTLPAPPFVNVTLKAQTVNVPLPPGTVVHLPGQTVWS